MEETRRALRADGKPLSITGSQIEGTDIEATDFPPELLEQAEKASRAFKAQAEEATELMKAELMRGERKE